MRITEYFNAKVDFTKWKNRKWVIAFSGGADSSVLLTLATQNRQLASHLEAVYVHHHLQKCADDWVIFCQNKCAELGVDFTTEHVYVDTDKGSVEANAREARYKALSKHLDANSVLFTAHHANDLLESMLLSLFRGSSLRGLTSLREGKTFGKAILARPLLQFKRSEIEEYCQENHISYVTDPTNAQNDYDRNFIRNRITPLLQERFPHCLESTLLTSRHLEEEEEILDTYLESKLQKYTEEKFNQKLLNLEELLDNKAEATQLIRMFLRKNFNTVLSHEKTTSLLKLFNAERNDERGFVTENGYLFAAYRDRLYGVPDGLQDLRGLKVTFSKNTPKVAVKGWEITLSQESLIEEITLVFLPPLSSKIKFLNKKHSTLLKNFWKEEGVPVYLRGLFPLVYENDNFLGIARIKGNFPQGFAFEIKKLA